MAAARALLACKCFFRLAHIGTLLYTAQVVTLQYYFQPSTRIVIRTLPMLDLLFC